MLFKGIHLILIASALNIPGSSFVINRYTSITQFEDCRRQKGNYSIDRFTSRIQKDVVTFRAHSTPILGPRHLALSFSLVGFTAMLMNIFHMNQTAKQMLISATRMSVQLLLISSFILSQLFIRGESNAMIVLLWLFGIGFATSVEATNRVKEQNRYRKLFQDCFISINAVVLSTTVFLLSFVLKSDPYLSPSKVIPIGGMLFGNCLTGISLGINNLLDDFEQDNVKTIEYRLAFGANIAECSLSFIQKAINTAMAPTMNAMAATGIITIPGIMTGQILGGQSPVSAAASQIVIYCALSATKGLSLLMMTALLLSRKFCLKDVRLRSESQRISILPQKRNLLSSVLPFLWIERSSEKVSPTTQCEPKIVTMHRSISPETPLLKINHLQVKKANMIVTLALKKGDICAIVGKSGTGKTQLLRTIIGLNEIENGEIIHDGKTYLNTSKTMWRKDIIWVPQDRVSEYGTPREFYERVRCYHCRNSNAEQSIDEVSSLTPVEIAAHWSMREEVFDKPWLQLSGGEAQRAALAIAISLKPSILLLDEPTSACDFVTTLQIEESLKKSEITILMVSHDLAQVSRMSTCKIQI